MTKPTLCRRDLLAGAAGLLAAPALAQDYPSRPVSIVVPYGPGSFTDNMMRPVAQGLQKIFGQPVIIENRAGASGIVGTQFVARAKPDGHTLLAGSSTTLAANLGLFKSVPYDPQKDFTPVAGLVSTAMLFVTRADLTPKDMRAFLSYLTQQREPVAIAYGSASAQVALALFQKVSEARFIAVPYRDTPQTITDLLGGQIEMGVIDVSNGVPHVKAGRLRALAVSSARRSEYLPETPTLGETWPGTELVTWIGLVGPAGTPAPVISRLEEALSTVMATPELRQRYATIGGEIDHVGQAALAQRMQRDYRQWLELIRLAGIEPQ